MFFENVNFAELFQLKDKYPEVYQKVKGRLDSGWGPAIHLLMLGKEQGVIKPDANILVFKMMMETSLSAFFENDILKKSGLTYREGLDIVVDILLDGIMA